MRIVSLEPFLTELVCYFGREAELVGISHRCDHPESIVSLPRLTFDDEGARGEFAKLNRYEVRVDELVDLKPDVVLTAVTGESDEAAATALALTESLRALTGSNVRVLSYQPRSLDSIYETYERCGKDLGAAQAGHELAQRTKAQLMDWADNFYERMKNKRVTLIDSVDPLRLGGYWIPDLIKLASAMSHEPSRGETGSLVSWNDVVAFKPDVIVVAPAGSTLIDAAKLFKRFEKLPGWADISAVKRGEVIFTAGLLDRPGPRLREGAAILFSAIAGLESGYITPRDCFYRLRWLELQRHRF